MEQLGLPNEIKYPSDIDTIIDYIKNNTLKDLKLYEYKVIEITKYTEEIRKALELRNVKCDPSAFANVTQLPVKERTALFAEQVIQNGHRGSRYHKSIDVSKAMSFLLALNHISSLDQVLDDRVTALAESFQGLLNDYNLPLYEEYDEESKVALENIKGRLLFTRLAENGPKLGTITKR